MKLLEKDLNRNRKEIFTKTVWRENENRIEQEAVTIIRSASRHILRLYAVAKV